jgi:hypothetical protein
LLRSLAMASPPPVSQPTATRSPDKSNVDLRHPVPDLDRQSLQGAYVGNIERLEEHAERMSEHGSDLGEEIRKLHTELKRSDSRRSSLRSNAAFEEPLRQVSTRSRKLSTGSQTHSIVDLNGGARWGGYSPGGYVTSPVGSLRSGSWSIPSAPALRQRSESKASRLGQVVHPEEVVEGHADFAYPGSPQSAARSPDSPPRALRKVSSFTRAFDAIADELRNSVILDHTDAPHQDPQRQTAGYHDYPDRPPTAASTDTTRQARSLWQDFDGVHCPDTVPEEEPTPTHSRQSSYNSMMRASYAPPAQAAPPPDDGMVFYPAPVPRMLNLPKRLSQLPASNIQARRRTQLLDSMQAGNRMSAPLLGDAVGEPSNRPNKARQSIAGLPPQLRASAYFDHIGPAQEFAVKGESAEQTLDSILDASARAPVTAFTDHPFAGPVGNEVYGQEHKRKSSMFSAMPPKPEATKRRSSFIMLDTKRNSSGDMLNKLKKRNSSADMNLLLVKAAGSRASLGGGLDQPDEHDRGPQLQEEYASRRSYDDEEGHNPDDVYEEEHVGEEHEEELEEPQFFGAPTTLLAELQLRKAKQQTRKMNYATLVEQGNMPTHRTLLELDDIAEREKQRRLKKKVNLAWEAQTEDDSDDDVPLGVLYQQPQHQNKHDWDRPLGLIAQRELEQQEPLNRRRARLRGEDPSRSLGPSPSQAHLAVPTTTTPGPESDEEEGETLAERMRRIREKKEREAALGDDVRKSTVSTDFASEMFSKLGVSDGGDKDISNPMPSPGIDEEETLGQRRARLQAEAAARGDAPTTRPNLNPSLSLADVLSANPLDTHNQARKVSDRELISHLPQGSLLQQSVVAEERRKTQMLSQNMRASSYSPLLRNMNDKQATAGARAPSMLLNSHPNIAAQRESAMPQGMMMNGMGMMSQPNLMQNPQMMNMNMGMMSMQPQMGFQYPQPVPGMRAPSMMGMPMGGMPMMGMNGGMPMMNMGVNGGMGMMMPPMDPRSRDQIDRWMQDIQH